MVLLSLFIGQIIFYFLVKLFKNYAFLISFLIYIVCLNYYIFFPSTVGNILFITIFRTGWGLFFLSLGYYSFELFEKYGKKCNCLPVIILLCFLLVCSLINGQVDMWGVGFGKNTFLYSFFSISKTYLFIMLSCLIRENKYIEFWSVNAIGVIGTQKIFMDIITKYIVENNVLIILVLLLMFEFIYISIMKKLIPKLV